VGDLLKDLSHAVADAVAFDRVIVVGLQRAVGHAVTIGTKRARSEHAWQDRTYATRDALLGAVEDTGRGATGTFGPADTKGGENAVRLATGTPPHRIEARRAKFLRFQAGGDTLFRRGVNHPGTKPDPYLDLAAESAGEELLLAVEQILDEALG
jgi:hypothetical protein